MATKTEIDPLTGLRGVAILLVIYAHYFAWCAPYTMASVPPPFLNSAQSSSFGMTLFFTLSGALMTYHYLDFGWRDTPLASCGRFVFLRLSRLYPVFLLYCILQIKRLGFGYYGDQWLLPNVINWLSLESWYPIQFAGSLVDGHGYSLSWSISTEIGMYLMFGAALVVASRFGKAMGAVLAVGAAVYVAAIVLIVLSPAGAIARLASLPTVLQPLNANGAWRWFYYLSPYFRFAEFILGAAAAVVILQGWDIRWRRAIAVLASLALAGLIGLYVGVIVGSSIRLEVVDLWQSVCFALLIANARANNLVNRVLSSRGLLFVGLVSYSLYLFQGYPATWAGASNILKFEWNLVPEFLAGVALTLGFALILAYGCYQLIELPAKNALRAALGRVIRYFREWEGWRRFRPGFAASPSSWSVGGSTIGIPGIPSSTAPLLEETGQASTLRD